MPENGIETDARSVGRFSVVLSTCHGLTLLLALQSICLIFSCSFQVTRVCQMLVSLSPLSCFLRFIFECTVHHPWYFCHALCGTEVLFFEELSIEFLIHQACNDVICIVCLAETTLVASFYFTESFQCRIWSSFDVCIFL